MDSPIRRYGSTMGAPDQLAEKILALLGSPQLQQQFSRKGIQRVRDQFDVRTMVRNVEAVYDRVLMDREAA